jgi:aspartyl-tRNA(Asn)/glutamyl-tRNA(Gln) amidotransferase subunit A
MAVPGAYGLTVMHEVTQVHQAFSDRDPALYSAPLRGRLERARQVREQEHRWAHTAGAAWADAWRDLLRDERLDAVAHPTVPHLAPELTVDRWEDLPSVAPSKAWSITGFPALSVPVGLDGPGLPVGLTLAGLPEHEADLVGLGIALDEDVQLWRTSPPL